MRFRNHVGFGLLAAVLAAGCASRDEATDPGDELAVGTIVSRIDGSDWSTTNAIAIYPGGRLVASGTGSGNLTFGFGVNAQAPGTYMTGGSGNASGSLADSNNSVWEATVPGGSGSITISSFAANEVAGTFSFTLVRSLGTSAPPTRMVTNGRFRVRY
jgi:hypothetical protein